MQKQYDYDLFVIGAGSGGVRAARIAAGHGAKVAVAERARLGGTCVNVGCVPKKLMTYAASYADHVEDAAGFGWTIGAAAHDWPAFIAAKDKEISRLNGIYQNLLEKSGAEILRGDARLTGPHDIDVGGKKYTAKNILIAVGGAPFVPDIPGAREHGLTSDDMFTLKQRPEKMIVVGAGYIGLEFAGIFSRLGTQVTLVHRRDLILNENFDGEVRRFLQNEIVKQGVEFSFQCQIEKVEKAGTGVRVHRTGCDPVEVDCILFATGRKANIDGLGLEEAGVKTDKRGAISVDEQGRTSVSHIYAIGDVTERIELTPVATGEGHALADRLFGNRPDKYISYENVPSAVFSSPPLASVGMTQEQAEAKHPGKIDIYKSDFKAMRFTLAGRDERTFMKLVVQRDTGKVLGLHMAGQDAAEIVQGFAVALKAGATKADFDATIGIHPTSAEEFVTMRTKA